MIFKPVRKLDLFRTLAWYTASLAVQCGEG